MPIGPESYTYYPKVPLSAWPAHAYGMNRQRSCLIPVRKGRLVPQNQPVIALVDDDFSIRQALVRLLHAMGWQPVTFASGEAFLAAARQAPPDCAVLDVWLPGRSGVEVLEEMAAAGLVVPAIVMTGRDDIQIRARAVQAGAVAYLCKPVDERELLEAIRRALGVAGG